MSPINVLWACTREWVLSSMVHVTSVEPLDQPEGTICVHLIFIRILNTKIFLGDTLFTIISEEITNM